jgi:hypothetical protein
LEKHIAMAKDLKMVHAELVSPADIHFDIQNRYGFVLLD